MSKYLINSTSGDIFISDTGITIEADSTYEIPPQDWSLWAVSLGIVENVVSGNLKVSDGENILPTRTAIGYLQDNQITTNEFYTLVQGDDILIGNGSILYLNDRFDNTSGIPEYMDQYIEEDDD